MCVCVSGRNRMERRGAKRSRNLNALVNNATLSRKITSALIARLVNSTTRICSSVPPRVYGCLKLQADEITAFSRHRFPIDRKRKLLAFAALINYASRTRGNTRFDASLFLPPSIRNSTTAGKDRGGEF